MRWTPLLALLPLLVANAGCAADAEPEAPADEAALGGPDISDLMHLASGSTSSSQTPMGRYYEDAARHVVTSAERAFLTDPGQLPRVPPSVSHLRFHPFPVELYPSGRPRPADVNQRAIGDCSAAAVMASIALLNPGFIERIVHDRGDGTFTVDAFDPRGRPMTIGVDSRFLGGSSTRLEAVASKTGKADWATVLEKAMMKYLDVFEITPRIGGIGSELASPILTGTGSSFAFMPGTLGTSQLSRVVRGTLGRGKIVIGGFRNVRPVGDLKTVTLHAYSILIPDPGAMISMRNPWGRTPRVNGSDDTSSDGVLEVPATSTFASEIDLRIIEPGAALGAGISAPYVP
jgi:hypothetical protein